MIIENIIIVSAALAILIRVILAFICIYIHTRFWKFVNYKEKNIKLVYVLVVHVLAFQFYIKKIKVIEIILFFRNKLNIVVKLTN